MWKIDLDLFLEALLPLLVSHGFYLCDALCGEQFLEPALLVLHWCRPSPPHLAKHNDAHTTTLFAHVHKHTQPTNIAVIKYWGKRSVELNTPINSRCVFAWLEICLSVSSSVCTDAAVGARAR